MEVSFHAKKWMLNFHLTSTSSPNPFSLGRRGVESRLFKGLAMKKIYNKYFS